MALNRKQLALIHVAKAKTGMTDEEYEAMLAGYGVESSKHLTARAFDDVMKRFKALGFQAVRKYRRPPESKNRLTAKIYAIRQELGLPDSYIDSMARHMFGVDSYRWLNSDQLHKMVAALAIHQKRRRNQ